MQSIPTANNALKQFNCLPKGLLDISVEALHSLIPEPALFHLPGKRPGTLFVSVLLHGNEPTGFLAVQKLLQNDGNPITEQFFALVDGQLQITRTTMPSMLTQNERVIRQDRLCYLMECIQF
ncbi:MAG: hypothetical protein LUQ11_04340 [Methylococcaceae bacterium]|nr:hypothetical protein [Methylococcaceae bacterium]